MCRPGRHFDGESERGRHGYSEGPSAAPVAPRAYDLEGLSKMPHADYNLLAEAMVAAIARELVNELRPTLAAVVRQEMRAFTSHWLDPDRMLSPKEVSAWVGIPEQTLATWRCTALAGPPWAKLGGLVRYPAKDVAAWVERSRRS